MIYVIPDCPEVYANFRTAELRNLIWNCRHPAGRAIEYSVAAIGIARIAICGAVEASTSACKVPANEVNTLMLRYHSALF